MINGYRVAFKDNYVEIKKVEKVDAANAVIRMQLVVAN